MEKFTLAVVSFVAVTALALLFALLFAVFTQIAWDGSIAEIFNVPKITFWQAFCLNLLGSMVFKSSSVSTK